MADNDHIAQLMKLPDYWNAWREKNSIRPDLSWAELTRAFLRQANLENADLSHANLEKAIVSRADLVARTSARRPSERRT